MDTMCRNRDASLAALILSLPATAIDVVSYFFYAWIFFLKQVKN
jgi:hypothetical protein